MTAIEKEKSLRYRGIKGDYWTKLFNCNRSLPSKRKSIDTKRKKKLTKIFTTANIVDF